MSVHNSEFFFLILNLTVFEEFVSVHEYLEILPTLISMFNTTVQLSKRFRNNFVPNSE